jgi:hypothetical protein
VAAKMDFGEASFSRSTIERKRSKSRKKIAEKIKNDFLLTPKSNLVVHWDGKLLENFTNTANTDEKVERIAVAVTGMEVSKILGIPKAISGTGAAQADIVFNLLKEWDLVDCIIGMSFDTTSSNTGIRNGACVILERLLGKKLLYLACRHHILELVVENVFKIYFGTTTSPDVKFFNDLKKTWPDLEKTNLKPLEDKRLSRPFAKKAKKDTIDFLRAVQENPENYCPRGDYLELCELTLLVLGEAPKANYKLKKPGFIIINLYYHAKN